MSTGLLGSDWHGQIYSGGWRGGRGGTTTTIEPATGASLGTIGLATAQDVDDADRHAAADARTSGFAGGQQMPVGLGGQSRRFPQFAEHETDLEGGLPRNRPTFPDEPFLELAAVRLQRLRDLPDHCRALS